MAAVFPIILGQLTVRLACSEEQAGGLPNGWKRSETIPAMEQRGRVTLRESVLTVWVEQGWLIVRRATAEGEIEWQVVLALANDPAEPKISVVAEAGSLQVRYRDYFIRESPPINSALALRVYRERKTAESSDWPALDLSEARRFGQGFGVASCVLDDWIWVESMTPRAKAPDIWIRLQHLKIRDAQRIPPATDETAANAQRPGEWTPLSTGWGLSATRDGVGSMFYGTRGMQDEGDLLLASRASFDNINYILRKRKFVEVLGGDKPPDLTTGVWLRDVRPMALDKLKGKVVLLYFWSAKSGSSVRQSTRVEALHKKFGPSGLVVIGVHSADDIDAAGQIIKDKGLTFPVMIDTSNPDAGQRPGFAPKIAGLPVIGETAGRYATDFLPNYFLIDKSGELFWGFSLDPPTEVQIEGLLK